MSNFTPVSFITVKEHENRLMTMMLGMFMTELTIIVLLQVIIKIYE